MEKLRCVAAHCEGYSFFKVVNRGVPSEIISKEEEILHFSVSQRLRNMKQVQQTPLVMAVRILVSRTNIGEVE